MFILIDQRYVVLVGRPTCDCQGSPGSINGSCSSRLSFSGSWTVCWGWTAPGDTIQGVTP